MATLLDRLLGRPEPVARKAVTGPGVVAMTYDVPLTSMSRNVQKLSREAQSVYHTNPWAYLAENSVSGVASGVEFHVEDSNGERVPETHPALVPLYRPSPLQDGRARMRRRPMWHLTLRHGGMAGDAFWYADALGSDGIPQGFIYINPARMWEAADDAGNLVGWVMDADRPNGRQPVGFEVSEILHFVYDPPDWGHRGIGIIEPAWRKLNLTDAADIHAEKSIRSGGRKPGIISPTDGKTFNEDEYQAIVRELRNVTDSPDAAKKSLIFKAPVDYKDAGVAPSQMQLSELMRMSKEDILALWKVSPSQVGITSGRGLNSGDTQKYEEASTWQNAREPRLDMLRETLQDDYLDRFGFTLVLNTPTFDDQTPLYDLASKATNLPLTNNQRLALVGLPAITDEVIGGAIYLPSTLVPIGQVADDGEQTIQAGGEVKGRLIFSSLRDRVEASHLPQLRRSLEKVLKEQKAELTSRIERFHAQIAAKPSDLTVWWNEEREYRRLFGVVTPLLTDIAGEVSRKTSATFFRPAKADSLVRSLEFVLQRSGVRIKGINDTTRDAVRVVLEDGIRQGLSPAELGNRIADLTQFDEARAEMIARTESGYALNDGALSTYRDFDVNHVIVTDGDVDEVCSHANGSEWSLEEAMGNPLGHPNCTRDFSPVVKGIPETPVNIQTMPLPTLNFTMPDPQIIPPPTVNVAAAKAPEVTVNMDTSQFAKALAEIRAEINRPRTRILLRDEAGKLLGSREE